MRRLAAMSSITFSVKDICERFAVGEHSVLAWISSGDLRAINVGRKPGAKKPRWRITEEALEAFELSRTATPPPPKAQRRKRSAEIIEFYK
jgi:excisionase family DNA binding protein